MDGATSYPELTTTSLNFHFIKQSLNISYLSFVLIYAQCLGKLKYCVDYLTQVS